jgi:hypothetical protein
MNFLYFIITKTLNYTGFVLLLIAYFLHSTITREQQISGVTDVYSEANDFNGTDQKESHPNLRMCWCSGNIGIGV